VKDSLNESIAECNSLQSTTAGRAYKALLEDAVDDWTKTLVETDDESESQQLKGAIRKVGYLLNRVEEQAT